MEGAQRERLARHCARADAKVLCHRRNSVSSAAWAIWAPMALPQQRPDPPELSRGGAREGLNGSALLTLAQPVALASSILQLGVLGPSGALL